MQLTELTSAQIEKYRKRSISWLRKRATFYFNAFIRTRDAGQRCISCNSYNTSQASHFYSAGNYPALAYNEDNCHSACLKCNMYLSGNLVEYRKRLEQKIGHERLQQLDELAAYHKRTVFKHDKFFLISVILSYQ